MFYLWILTQTARRDGIGDLARSVSKDKTFPRFANKLHYFLHYYRKDPDLRFQVKRAHAEWRAYSRRKALGAIR